MRLLSLTLRRTGSQLTVDAQSSEPGLTTQLFASDTLKLDLDSLRQLHFPRDLGEQRDYGILLGTAVFTGNVADIYSDVRARMQTNDLLHVTLSIEDYELKTLRWERLCAPVGSRTAPAWEFLRLQQNTPFSIDLRSATDRRYPAISRVGLKALVVVADLGKSRFNRLVPFDAEQTVAGIRTALGNIPCRVLASSNGNQLSGADGLPTVDAICEWLTKEQFAILHMVCHGEFLKWTDKDENENDVSREDTFLYLHQAGEIGSSKVDDHAARIATSDFLVRLGQLSQLPHLAFLCSCSTASSEADTTIGGFGERLVSELAMPAVIAMREPVPIPLANKMSTEFYRYLRIHGEVDQALAQACAGQAGDSGILIPALFTRLSGRKLFDDSQELTTGEWSFGLDRLLPLLQQRAPILESAYQQIADNSRPAIEIKRHAELSAITTADASAAEQKLRSQQVYLNELCQDVLENSFAHVAKDLPLAIEVYDRRCPFPGLGVFDQVNQGDEVEDFRPFFFGRDEQIRDLRSRLFEPRFIAVIGGSGSGKSSLVRAGLIGALQHDKTDFRVILFVPGHDPLAHLNSELQLLPRPELIVVDQFEEIFTLCRDPVQRNEFVGNLLELSQQLPVVVTMRDDFLGDCIQIDALNELLNAREGGHWLLVRPLTPEELRDVVEQQANAVGLRFEPGLAGQIFEDLGAEPGAMPLLQHCLRQLWLYRHGRWLRWAEYCNEDRIGGVKGAIAKTAETVYCRLERELPQAKSLLPHIFERLTRIDENANAVGGHRDTRRRVALSDLTPDGFDPSFTKKIVSQLADERLLMIRTETQAGGTHVGEPQVEVAHEAVIQRWPRLQRWLDDARVDARMVDRIRQDAQQYEVASVGENLTLRGAVLLEANRLATASPCRLSSSEVQFIRLCDRAESRIRREKLRRKFVAALAAVTVLALIVGLAFVVRNRRLLKAAAVEDLSRRSALTAFAVRDSGDTIRAANLFARAAKITRDPGKQQRLQFATHHLTRNIHLTAIIEHKVLIGVKVLSGSNQTITWSRDGTIRIWNGDGEQVAQEKSMIHPTEDKHIDVAVSDDQATALSWSRDGSIRIWDLATQTRRAFPHTRPGLLGVQFARNNEFASWSSDGQVRFYDASSLLELEGKQFSVADQLRNDIQFNASGTLAFGWFETDYVIRDLEQAVDIERKQLKNATEELYIVGAKFIDDSRVAVWEESNGLHILDSKSPTERPLLLHGGVVGGCNLFASKNLLLTWAADNSARLWTMGNPLAKEYPIDPEKLTGAIFDPSNDLLTTCSKDGVIQLWRSNSRSPVATLNSPGVTDAMLDANHRLIAWGGADGSVAIWDVHEPSYPSLLGKMQHFSTVSGVIASGDEIRTWCRDDDSVRLWKIEPSDQISLTHTTVQGASWIDSGRIMTWGGVKEANVLEQGKEASVREWDVRDPSKPSKPEVFLSKPIRGFIPLGPNRFIASCLGNSLVYQPAFSTAQKLCENCTIVGLKCDSKKEMCCIWTNTGKAYVVHPHSQSPSLVDIATKAICDVGFNAASDELVLCCDDGVYTCPLSFSTELIATRKTPSEAIAGGKFSDDTKRLVCWNDRGEVSSWSRNLSTSNLGKLVEIKGVTFSPQASSAIVWGHGLATLIDLGSLDLQPLEFHMIDNSGAIITKTRIVTWGGNDVRISNLADNQPVNRVTHQQFVRGVVASSDETILLSYGDDGTARIWDAQTADLLATFQLDQKVKYCQFLIESLTFLAVLEGDKVVICDLHEADTSKVNLVTGTTLTKGSQMEVMQQSQWNSIRKP